MCIAIIKPKGANLPNMDILHNCWVNNSDGAGYMVMRKGRIHIKKGFMQWKHFKKAIKREGLGKEDLAILHFRIATHGAIDEGHCHPFPVSGKMTDLMKTETTCDYAMVHNGVFHIDVKDALSDSQQVIKDILAPIGTRVYKDQAILKLVESYVTGSRVVLLHNQFGLLIFGKWITAYGCQFSNSGYEPVIAPKWRGYSAKGIDEMTYTEWLAAMDREERIESMMSV
jgi:hypothetical protein